MGTHPALARQEPRAPHHRRGRISPRRGRLALVLRRHRRLGRGLGATGGWGCPSPPPRRLLFNPDIPRPPDALPRALTPDVDRALTTAIANLDDALVRTGLLLLRATGMRIGGRL